MTMLLADPPRGRPILLTDPELKASVRASRAAADGDKWNEVWDGVLVMPTLPNDEHQEIQCRLMFPLTQLFEMTQRGKVRAGVNITDRSDDWKQNFRGPDIVVYLPDNPAINLGSHWLGGPDFLVEIVSPGDLAWDKLPFYAKVNTREVLIVNRDPWELELYQLRDGKLELVGRSNRENAATLRSGALSLSFELRGGAPRPTIHITHGITGDSWTA